MNPNDPNKVWVIGVIHICVYCRAQLIYNLSMRPFSSASFMNLKLKDNPDQVGILAGVVLLVLALGFMTYKLMSIQGQVASLTSQQKVLQTVPPSAQLSNDAMAKKNILDALK